MKLNADIEVCVARLHRAKIALYEKIHDGTTAEHAAATSAAYERIDIYRLDDLLIMLVERRPGPAPEPSETDKARTKKWHADLAECFAEPWRAADPIYMLSWFESQKNGASVPQLLSKPESA